MCGIAGTIGLNGKTITSDSLDDRGPDDTGTWSDEHALLHHWRLKVIDLSDNARQPMVSSDNQVVLVFNGEIYNFQSLREQLAADGAKFQSTSDTEVLLRLYERDGIDCLDSLDGMFAFAIWDKRMKRLFCARDQLGKKPFFYSIQNNGFSFCSGLEPLVRAGLTSATPNEEALAHFWHRRYIPAPLTAIQDAHKLQPGHALIWQNQTLNVWQYHSPDQNVFDGSYTDATNEVRRLILQATKTRMVSDVPVGLSLSGGLDSACVAAAASITNPNAPLTTVTVRPTDASSTWDEGYHAQLTANHLGTDHHELVVQPQFDACINHLVTHFGEPFADASMIPSYYLYKELKTKVTVALSGDGGDEVFAGYPHYHRRQLWTRTKNVSPRFLRKQARKLLLKLYDKYPATRKKLKAPLIVLQMLEETYAGHPARGLASEVDWEWNRVLTHHAREQWTLTHIDRYIDRLEETLTEVSPLKRMMQSDQTDWLPHDILAKVDNCSMAHGLEVRSPLLDRKLLAFTRSLPKEFLVDSHGGKRILRDAFKRDLHPEVATKKKTGFGLPLRDHFRGNLRPYLETTLSEPHPLFNRYFHQKAVTTVVQEHMDDIQNHTSLIFKLLVARKWMESTPLS